MCLLAAVGPTGSRRRASQTTQCQYPSTKGLPSLQPPLFVSMNWKLQVSLNYNQLPPATQLSTETSAENPRSEKLATPGYPTVYRDLCKEPHKAKKQHCKREKEWWKAVLGQQCNKVNKTDMQKTEAEIYEKFPNENEEIGEKLFGWVWGHSIDSRQTATNNHSLCLMCLQLPKHSPRRKVQTADDEMMDGRSIR